MRRRPLQRNGKAGVQPPDLGQRRPVAAPDLGHPRPFEDRVEHHGVLFRRPVAAHAAVGYLPVPTAHHAPTGRTEARTPAGRHDDPHRCLAAQTGHQQPDKQRREVYRQGQHYIRVPHGRGRGRGISQEHVGRIFERFYKTDSNAKGVGLGLSICRTIIEILGGDISVVSAPGKGTCFKIVHPVHRTETAAETAGAYR